MRIEWRNWNEFSGGVGELLCKLKALIELSATYLYSKLAVVPTFFGPASEIRYEEAGTGSYNSSDNHATKTDHRYKNRDLARREFLKDVIHVWAL
jgi:hypothetical protein